MKRIWFGDIFAVLSAAIVAAALTITVYMVFHGVIIRDIIISQRPWRLIFPQFILVATPFYLIMWFWMLIDCIKQICKMKESRHVWWLIGLLCAANPVIWVYYFVERRPRRLSLK